MEAEKVAMAFDSGNFTDFIQHGMYIEDVRYTIISSDSNALFAENRDVGALSMAKSIMTVVIALMREDGACMNDRGEVVSAVSSMAKDLESLNS